MYLKTNKQKTLFSHSSRVQESNIRGLALPSLASSSFRWLQVLCGLLLFNTNLCLYLHMVFSSMPVCSPFLSFIRISFIGLGPTQIIQDYLKLFILQMINFIDYSFTTLWPTSSSPCALPLEVRRAGIFFSVHASKRVGSPSG